MTVQLSVELFPEWILDGVAVNEEMTGTWAFALSPTAIQATPQTIASATIRRRRFRWQGGVVCTGEPMAQAFRPAYTIFAYPWLRRLVAKRWC